MVQEVTGEAEFRRLTQQKGKLVVVDFTATWCGPCKMVAPQYEMLATQHPDVVFLKVVEDASGESKELVTNLSIRAFPTFRFYLEGSQVDETRGANIAEVARKVEQHKASVRPAFGGEGLSLGGGGGNSEPLSTEDARSKRLARFASQITSGEGAKPDPEVAKRNAKILAAAGAGDVKVSAPAAAPTPMELDVPAAAAAGATGATAGGGGAGSGGKLGGSKPLRKADPELVAQLVEMGFSETRAKKAFMFGTMPDLEGAVNWLMEHQEDPDIDDAILEDDSDGAGPMDVAATGGAVGSAIDGATSTAEVAGGTAQSLKCDECRTTLKDVTAAELHAHKTGHSDFSESTEAVKALTPEEKAAKIAKMKDLLAARRVARDQDEKVDGVKREKARRTMGKEALKTREEMETIARKHEIAKAKKEKEEFARERARLKEEIARDKAERKARGGKLGTKLGVDGYNPSAPQGSYAAPAEGAAVDTAKPEADAEAKPQENSEEKMAKAVDFLARQTVAGLGGTAMKTCLAYIKNALLKPEEEKFRSINLDNNAYKTRVASCIGGTALLRAVGFAKEEGRLYMSLEARDEKLLAAAKEKLEATLASYVPAKAN